MFLKQLCTDPQLILTFAFRFGRCFFRPPWLCLSGQHPSMMLLKGPFADTQAILIFAFAFRFASSFVLVPLAWPSGQHRSIMLLNCLFADPQSILTFAFRFANSFVQIPLAWPFRPASIDHVFQGALRRHPSHFDFRLSVRQPFRSDPLGFAFPASIGRSCVTTGFSQTPNRS